MSSQGESRKSIIKSVGSSLFWVVLLSLPPVFGRAEISLEGSWKIDAMESLSSIVELKSGQILVSDAESNQLAVLIPEKNTATVSAHEAVFEDRGITAMVAMGDDMLLAVNRESSRFATLTEKGERLSRMGESGASAGEIDSPKGIAYSSNRRIYIADTDNNRISLFGPDGVYLGAIGQAGLKDSERLREPLQLFIDEQERVIVLEGAERGQIAVFSSDGALIKRIPHEQLSNLLGAEGKFTAIANAGNERIYLADSQNGRIYLVNWSKQVKENAFGSHGDERGQFQYVSAMLLLSNGGVAVADRINRKIEIFKVSEHEREEIEPRRLATVTRYLPVKMKCHKAFRLTDDRALCVDEDRSKVKIFSDKSKYIKDLEGIKKAEAITVSDKYIGVVDSGRIRLYDTQGNQIEKGNGFAGEGSSPGKLSGAKGLYIKGRKIYVADTGNERVQVFSLDGIYLDKIEAQRENREFSFENPANVVVDSQGNIIVADSGHNRVMIFNDRLEYLYAIGSGTATENFERLYDISLDADNNLYVLCGERNNRYTVQVYNGPRKVISFAAQSELDTGFSDPQNISVSLSRQRLIGVYDADKEKLLNFSYQQVPGTVGNVTVAGGLSETTVSWDAVPGSFIKGYNVYGAVKADGPYRFVSQVQSRDAKIKNNEQRYTFYRVNAYAGLGSLGNYSRYVEDVFFRGYTHYKKGDYTSAASIFKAALEHNYNQPETLKFYGLSLLELDEPEMANEAFRQMQGHADYYNEALNLQIRSLMQAGDLLAARVIVDKLMSSGSVQKETYKFCGELSLKMNDGIGAINCLEEAIAHSPDDIQLHFLMAKAYVKLGIVDKGLAEFDKAIAMSEDNADIWYQAALLLRELGRYDEATQRLKKAYELDGSNPQIQVALAQAMIQNQDLAAARNIAIRLSANDSHKAQGYYLLGLVEHAEDKHAEALLAFARATRLSANMTDAWLALADVYAEMEQPDKVKATLESAVKSDINSVIALQRLGFLEYKAANYETAITYLDKALLLRGDDPEISLTLAESHYASGSYSDAARYAALAMKLDETAVRPVVLMSLINDQQGKVGNAIDYMKQALKLEEGSFELQLGLGELYSENNLYELAENQLQKASLLNTKSERPYLLLGDLYLKRRLFDKSIESFDKAVSLKPSENTRAKLDAAYAEKKRSLDFKSNAPQIVLRDLQLNRVFSAAYKKYSDSPVGSVQLQNISGTNYRNLKLNFSIKGYMDFPVTIEVPELAAHEVMKVDLKAAFNNRILEIDEDTGVQAEVALKFVRGGRDDEIRLTQPMTIYGKNAIIWGDENMVGSFVTPRDDTLRDFVRSSINAYKPNHGPLSENLVTAMTMFDILTAHGIRYVSDPSNPFSEISPQQVDYVQFGRETLKIKSGDCDDLAVLLSASLENLGVSTAIVDVPGHLMMMFDSGVPFSQKDRISLQDELLVSYRGNVWIPIEATMIGTSFSEAWAEGARKYHKYNGLGELKSIALTEAWKQYPPVTLKPASYMLDAPPASRVESLVSRETRMLLQKSLDRLVKPYQTMAAMQKDNVEALMQVAIIYAKHGLYSQANKTFEDILKISPDNSAVHNNRGNIHFSLGDYNRAIETYSYAEQIAANDPGVKVNLAMSYYQLGMLDEARDKFEEARLINDKVDEEYDGLAKLLSR